MEYRAVSIKNQILILTEQEKEELFSCLRDNNAYQKDGISLSTENLLRLECIETGITGIV